MINPGSQLNSDGCGWTRRRHSGAEAKYSFGKAVKEAKDWVERN